MSLRFDGRVVLVTGAGGGAWPITYSFVLDFVGLGRCYALAFGERGAKVVVNDLGGDIKGGGGSSRPADLVVEEIRAKGGTAVANYDSVENGEKLVQTALDNFGRIDIIINNAGILRDRSFARISDTDWDLVQRVHLGGVFKVTQAAWPHMRKQNYGKIIMTSSASGLYGNFGQANYSAAKLGQLGLCNTLAIEGEKYNISCNTIVPTAGSRLTLTAMPPELCDILKPEYVVPMVVYLCHEDCTETGGVFEAAAGYQAKLRWQRARGALLRRKDEDMTPESIRDHWDKITNFDEPDYPTSLKEELAAFYSVMQRVEDDETDLTPKIKLNNTSGVDINPRSAVGHKMPPSTFTYTDKDVILYALGVGVSTGQADHLKFLYEYSDEFCVLPSFGVIPSFGSIMGLATGGVPGLHIDATQILHGEQYMELLKPLSTSGMLTSRGVVPDVVDKGSGAVIVIDVDTFDEHGEKVVHNQMIAFIQRMGGFGGPRQSNIIKPTAKHPDRAPDASVKQQTSVNQAALYRLSGDRNPLHIDPNFAAMGGFSRPILHGLSSFGHSVRHVLQQYADNDVTKFKAVKVRFTKPVLPGQTLQTDMWKEGNRVYFETKVVETGAVCLSGAYVDLVGSAGDSAAVPEMKEATPSDAIFAEISKRVAAKPELVSKVKAIFLFNITKNGKTAAKWTVDLKNGAGAVHAGEPKSGKPGCTLTLSEENFIQMALGKLSGQQAFLTGKLKIKGNIMLSTKLGQVFQEHSKL